jgi:hypothetical protein
VRVDIEPEIEGPDQPVLVEVALPFAARRRLEVVRVGKKEIEFRRPVSVEELEQDMGCDRGVDHRDDAREHTGPALEPLERGHGLAEAGSALAGLAMQIVGLLRPVEA